MRARRYTPRSPSWKIPKGTKANKKGDNVPWEPKPAEQPPVTADSLTMFMRCPEGHTIDKIDWRRVGCTPCKNGVSPRKDSDDARVH